MLNRSFLPLIVGLSASLIVACSGDDRTGTGTTPRPSADCGNGTLNSGEQCDDGNTTAGDGCSATCQTEMSMATCGDGAVDAGEQCDDGNTAAGDGCSATCQTEMSMATCGNGIIEGAEQCDDGNTTSGDGCSATCQGEMGAVCGDGVREGSEACDDGNTTSGDGCSSTCEMETMTATCQDACDLLVSCTEMQCPGTVDAGTCLSNCMADPVMFQRDLIVTLTCMDITDALCIVTQETDAGDACMSDMDCEAGVLQALCVLPTDPMGMPTGFADGYCTALGCNGDEACGAGNLCVTIDQMGSTACFAGCTPADNGTGVCRSGYQCLDLAGGMGMPVGACLPACASDMDCNGGTTCNTMTGQCT